MSHIKGYSTGDIQAKAAFTSEIEIAGSPTLQDVVNHQEAHRKTMDKRPGMYLKYLPHRYDAVNGGLRSGGAYLFDTLQDASDYWDWTTNEFEVNEPKVKFWSQPLFKSSKRFVWEVIGATNFAPVDVHAVGRFQRWSYEGPDLEEELRGLFPELKAKAEEQGAVAFWFLHHPTQKQIGIQLAFPKAEGDDPLAIGHESLARAASQVSLDSMFPNSIKMKKNVDYTSLFLAIWLPRSRLEGGGSSLSPNVSYPPSCTAGVAFHSAGVLRNLCLWYFTMLMYAGGSVIYKVVFSCKRTQSFVFRSLESTKRYQGRKTLQLANFFSSRI